MYPFLSFPKFPILSTLWASKLSHVQYLGQTLILSLAFHCQARGVTQSKAWNPEGMTRGMLCLEGLMWVVGILGFWAFQY